MPNRRQLSRQESTAASPEVRSLALRLPSGYRLEAHEHEWAQIIFAPRGVMSVEANLKQWIVPPQRCLWMPADVRHAIQTIGETWMRTVYLSVGAAARIAPGIRVVGVSPLLRELLLEVVRLGTLDHHVEAEMHLTRLLTARFADAPEVGLGLSLPTDSRARRVADRVRRAPGANASLAELARGTGASPRTVERLFVAETGLPFGRWRQQARLQHAVRRLSEGISVTNTSAECGYHSVSAFVTMFKRATGETPGQYA